MQQWVERPYLPQGPVSIMLCQENERLLRALQRRMIRTIPVSACPDLQTPVQAHPDMLVCPLGGREFVVASNAPPPLKCALKELEGACYESEQPLSRVYPHDIRLNFAPVGNWIIGNLTEMDAALMKASQHRGFHPVNVRQGYGKCSVAIVNETALITSDPGIADALKSFKIDVLCVRPGHIRLDGYDTGLIGGACGKLSPHSMAFCGDFMTHPDGKRIAEFLYAHKIHPISLWDGELLDVGSLIPIKETII